MTATKRPIEPSEIRKGDLIRWEGGEDSAHEYRASSPGLGWSSGRGKHYLLDRPTPAVELPTEPTLGFVTAAGGRKSAAIAGLSPTFSPLGGDDRIYLRAGDPFGWDKQSRITNFVPATAVPASALDEFRHKRETRNMINADIDRFLAAIDEANS